MTKVLDTSKVSDRQLGPVKALAERRIPDKVLKNLRRFDEHSFNSIRYRYAYDKADGNLIISKTQNVDELLRAINFLEAPRNTYGKSLKYLGSIPNVLALEWAKECGHPLYSKEWKEYSLKKLRSIEYAKLRPRL